MPAAPVAAGQVVVAEAAGVASGVDKRNGPGKSRGLFSAHVYSTGDDMTNKQGVPAPAFVPWAEEGVLVVLVACALAAPAATRKARPMLAERIE